MRVPTWLKPIIAGAVLSIVGWGITLDTRITRMEQFISDFVIRYAENSMRLSRIEHKLDVLILKEKQ